MQPTTILARTMVYGIKTKGAHVRMASVRNIPTFFGEYSPLSNQAFTPTPFTLQLGR